jgi:hypothetical protein
MLLLENKLEYYFLVSRKICYYMKRILTIFALVMTSLIVANRDQYCIERLVEPYEQAIEFITNLDPARQVNDHDVFVFFNKNDLYEKKDVRKFNRVLRMVKKLTYTKKSLRKNREQLEQLIDNLENIQNFIVDHASTHYALITYYEIAARYYYIDELHTAIADLIIQQSDKLGLPNMQGRGLYKFVKKIDLDIARLTILFVQSDLSDDLIVKVNKLKTKLVALKHKIISSDMYKAQLSKTRWLKAFALLGIPVSIIAIGGIIAATAGWATSELVVIPLLAAWGTGVLVTCDAFALRDMHEAYVYNLPLPRYTQHVLRSNRFAY